MDWEPTPLVIKAAQSLKPGRALDLACGAGRNALWLAERGWNVTAVDGSPTAIEVLRNRAAERGVTVDARVADLERGEYVIEPSRWDLIAMCHYLQRDLFETVQSGLVPGGVSMAIVHITEPGQEPTRHRLKPGELAAYFDRCEILHTYEGMANDTAHRHLVAEMIAMKTAVSDPRERTH